MMRDFDLRGRVALVTGGNRGIGKAIALGLARAGASVAVAARSEDKNEATVDELRKHGTRAVGFRCDVTQREDIEATVAATREALGGVHILVNNAGIAGGGTPAQIPEEVWDEVLTTNLKASFAFAQMVYPGMCEAGGGKIINLGSEYALFGSAVVLPYAASKGGVLQLTKSLAIAWARDNIQVNALVPGWIRTDMTAGVEATPAFRDAVLARTPAGRFGEPGEVAGAAIFLSAPASDFVTGIALPVDGGYAAS